MHGRAGPTTGTAVGVRSTSISASGFDLLADGAGTDYGSASFISWKRNVVAIDEPLARVENLRGVFFDWNEAHGGGHEIGLIAEEVGAGQPEVVEDEADGTDAIGMDYARVVPLLIAALEKLKGDNGDQNVGIGISAIASVLIICGGDTFASPTQISKKTGRLG